MKKNYIITALISFFISANGICQTWTSQTSGTTNFLYAVSAPSTAICYAAGVSGTILKTIDGGTTWLPLSSGTSQSLYSIFFTDALNGYAVGDNAAALKTTNGGTTWTAITLPISSTVGLRCVYFRDALNGYISGGTSGTVTGKILVTTDGGTTWANSTTAGASTSSIFSLFFISPTDGYATEYSGKILRTSNSGLSWVVMPSGTTTNLQNINFSSTSNGIAVGENGTIRKSTDGGSTWTTAVSGTTDYLPGVDFYSTTNGVVVGGNTIANTGLILTTTDGGTTWNSYSPGSARLYRVDMVNANTGYAVGNNGTILKYTSNVGVNELENQITLNSYPNPFTFSTIIDCGGHVFNKTASVEIYDISGKLLKNIQAVPQGNQITIQRDDLSSGIYFFKVYDGQEFAGAGKIIAE